MDTEPHQHNNAGIPVQAPRQAESSTTLSLGERLLPFLFAAMEACCVAMLLIGLAGISFLGASAPFFPLWAVFVALPGACWFVRYRRHLLAARSSKELLNGTALLVMAAIFAALAIPWLLHQDMLHIAAALIVFTFLCYRGFRIAEREIDPVYAAKTLRLGVAAVLLALFLQLIGGYAGVAPYAYGDLLLFATGFVFLFLSLLARSLANLSHVRQGHSIERRSDIRSQECAEMQMIVVLSLLFLLVALASASFASPGFLAHMQQFVAAGYVWATHIFATVIAAVLTPLFWLLSAIHFASPGTTHASTAASHLRSVGDYGNVHPSHQTSRPYPTNSHAGSASFTWISAVESAQPIVLIVLTATIFVWFVQRVLRRLRGASQPHEQRESIWSWSLFWRRLLAFWRILFGRLRSLREAGGWGERGGGTLDPASQLQEPPVRDIRALYHTLLRAAARRGYPRHRGETPFEFEQRLEQHVPAIKTQLATITAIYVAARYGGYVPGEAEIDHARDIWAQLEQSWRANSQA